MVTGLLVGLAFACGGQSAATDQADRRTDCAEVLADPAHAMAKVTERYPGQPVKVAETIERCIAPTGDDCERMAKILPVIPSMIGAGSAPASNVLEMCRGMPIEMRRCWFASYVLAHPDECTKLVEQMRNTPIQSIEIKPRPRSPAPTDPAAVATCTISVSIGTAGMWIGTPRGTCHAARSSTHSLDFEWMTAELKQLVATAPDVACSAELEMNGSGGSYQELIHTMDIANMVGISNVGLADPQDLAIKFPASPRGAASHCKALSIRAAKPPPDHHTAPRSDAPIASSDGPLRPLPGSGVNLPNYDSKTALQQAPVIIVTKTEILWEGQRVASLDRVPRDSSSRFTELFERLAATAKRIKTDLAILQADESTDVRVILTIVRTAKAAGFDNLLFAVKNQ